MCRLVPTLSYFYFFMNNRFARTSNHLENTFRHVAKVSNHSGNDFRPARKCQTTRETTFAMRGNVKPLGKRLSPCAEMSNQRFLYFNTTDNDIFKRTLNNRPTLHLVCNVGRKNLRVFMLKLYDVQLDFFILSLYPVLHFKSFNTTKVLHILCCYRKLNFL